MASITDLKGQELIKLLESGILIALFTALLFFVSWCYQKSYFERIGIKSNAINFTLDSYFSFSLPAIGTCLAIILILYICLTVDIKNKNERISIAYSHSLFLLLTVLCFWLAYNEYKLNHLFYPFILWIFGGFLTIGCFIYYVYKKKGLRSIWDEEDGKLVIIILLVCTVSLAAFINGDIQATRTIQGETRNSIFIDFQFINSNLTELNGKELILITHLEEKYYVTPLDKNASQYPTVYIIPDSQVELVTMNRIP